MHIIRTWADVSAYLDGSIDPALAQLLQTRRDQLIDLGDLPDLGTFVIIDCGDELQTIEGALQLPIATNLIDGKRFGDPDFMPSFEFIQRHDGCYELVFILSDDGFGHVVIVPDAEGVDSALLELCRTYGDSSDGQTADRAEGI